MKTIYRLLMLEKFKFCCNHHQHQNIALDPAIWAGIVENSLIESEMNQYLV